MAPVFNFEILQKEGEGKFVRVDNRVHFELASPKHSDIVTRHERNIQTLHGKPLIDDGGLASYYPPTDTITLSGNTSTCTLIGNPQEERTKTVAIVVTSTGKTVRTA